MGRLKARSFKLRDEDIRLLNAISIADDSHNMTATMRRLIRQEAARLGLLPQVKAELLAEAAKAE